MQFYTLRVERRCLVFYILTGCVSNNHYNDPPAPLTGSLIGCLWPCEQQLVVGGKFVSV